MQYFNIDSKPESIMLDNEGFIFAYQDGSKLKITEEFVQFTNKYGDVDIMDSKNYWNIPTHLPTYNELYEYWLRTKENKL